jgi:hypothetical protein
MPFFFLSVTMGVTDWLMSMDVHWYSTMFGAWYIVCSCGAGLAFSLLVFNANSDKEPYRSVLSPELGRDQGNMQFVLTMLWATPRSPSSSSFGTETFPRRRVITKSAAARCSPPEWRRTAGARSALRS